MLRPLYRAYKNICQKFVMFMRFFKPDTRQKMPFPLSCAYDMTNIYQKAAPNPFLDCRLLNRFRFVWLISSMLAWLLLN